PAIRTQVSQRAIFGDLIRPPRGAFYGHSFESDRSCSMTDVAGASARTHIAPLRTDRAAAGSTIYRVAAGSSGRWNVLSGSLFTSSMILAYARVLAWSPVQGTVSGVSRSVWK